MHVHNTTDPVEFGFASFPISNTKSFKTAEMEMEMKISPEILRSVQNPVHHWVTDKNYQLKMQIILFFKRRNIFEIIYFDTIHLNEKKEDE